MGDSRQMRGEKNIMMRNLRISFTIQPNKILILQPTQNTALATRSHCCHYIISIGVALLIATEIT